MECNSITRANFMPVQHCRTSELLRPLSNTKKKWSKEKFISKLQITLITMSRTITAAGLLNFWQELSNMQFLKADLQVQIKPSQAWDISFSNSSEFCALTQNSQHLIILSKI